jgi:hypothetical protein
VVIVCAGALPAPQGARGGTAIDWSVAARSTPLDAAEEASSAVVALARRFNPAMALPDRDAPWPVSVSYTWSAGADVRARAMAPDGSPVSDQVAVPSAQLGTAPWDRLPSQDGQGHRLEYWIDVPGDDRPERGVSGWRRRWSETVETGTAPPQTSAYPPTQYAHAFWLNRNRGLLAIQYWFYFPFNEWINHHEGDWEHINVILEGPSHLSATADFHAVGYEFYFHGWRTNPDRVVRVADSAGAGDHVVVYVGGRGRFLLWSGSQSGGSYPLPANYRGAGAGLGSLRPAEDTRGPGRFVAADAFQVVMLPEPDRLDAHRTPALSWLKLPFFAGSPRAYLNPPLFDRFGGGRAPAQPARRRDWNALATKPVWNGTPILDSRAPTVPAAWSLLATPAGRHQPLADLGTAADRSRSATP